LVIYQESLHDARSTKYKILVWLLGTGALYLNFSDCLFMYRWPF